MRKKLPESAGVYIFENNKNEKLYIGKSANIKERVKNHFRQPSYRDYLFLNKIRKIGYIETNSEIEALILEAKLIKKYQPKYNVVWRDDKNYFYIGITKEDFPRIFVSHQPKLEIRNWKLEINHIGPFVEGLPLKKTLQLLRRIFPYYHTLKKHPKGLCPWCHLKLCPGPNSDKKEYKKNIKNIIAVLEGKKRTVLKGLKKAMSFASRTQDFEKAVRIRDQIQALEKVLENARIFNQEEIIVDWRKTNKELRDILKIKKEVARIEAYDVSNIQGQQATGAMAVFIKGKADKNFYRKFKIKIAGKPNDIAMLKEVLSRRFNHPEWPFPDLILIDGGKAQLNIARKCLTSYVKRVKVMAIAKKNNELYVEGRKKPFLLKSFPREIFNLILRARDEAHRFAIAYHRKLRQKDLLQN